MASVVRRGTAAGLVNRKFLLPFGPSTRAWKEISSLTIQMPATGDSVRSSRNWAGGDEQTHLAVVEGFQQTGRIHSAAASPCFGYLGSWRLAQDGWKTHKLGRLHAPLPSPCAGMRLASSAAGGPLHEQSLGFSALLLDGPWIVMGSDSRAHPAPVASRQSPVASDYAMRAASAAASAASKQASKQAARNPTSSSSCRVFQPRRKSSMA